MHGGAVGGDDLELLRGGEMMNVAGHDVGVQERLIVGEDPHVRADGGGDGELEFVGRFS